MYLIRRRKLNVPGYGALVAALVLTATELYAAGNSIFHVLGSVNVAN